MKRDEEYSTFAPHGLHGQSPIFTNVVPVITANDKFALMRRCRGKKIIKGTAIEADEAKQTSSLYFVKYYFDETHHCPDCDRAFIFFAREQQFWFEDLGFSLDTIGKWCYDCRQLRNAGRYRKNRYGKLLNIKNPSLDDAVELAVITLEHLESGDFTQKKTGQVRAMINILAKGNQTENPDLPSQIKRLQERLAIFEDSCSSE